MKMKNPREWLHPKCFEKINGKGIDRLPLTAKSLYYHLKDASIDNVISEGDVDNIVEKNNMPKRLVAMLIYEDYLDVDADMFTIREDDDE